MRNDTEEAVRRLCLAFPAAEEFLSHGSLSYRIAGGKVFVTYVVNHHGDGRIALWLATPHDVQDAHVRAEPGHFFVPPYVGPKGWLGVRLDQGLAWKRVAPLVRIAYEHVTPARLRAQLGATPTVPAPGRRVTVAQADPLNTPQARKVLAELRGLCLALPGTSEATQFGRPAWRAGAKVFSNLYCVGTQLRAGFWVGVESQWLYTQDARYSIPAYRGHHGWLALDLDAGWRRSELEMLALGSYRHYATQRLLAQLPAPDTALAPPASRRRSP